MTIFYRRVRNLTVVAAVAAALAVVPAAAAAAAGSNSFVGPFHKITNVGSTVPPNGDVNPYGIVVVPTTTGKLTAGHILVSNFNASSNLQGTGSTIVELSPTGALQVFAHLTKASLPGSCPGGIGLTTALSVLPGGWVVVGSLPTSDGTAATAKAGCLIVLDSSGKPVETIAGGPINGPWDMTAVSTGAQQVDLFVSNVLNGTVAAGGNEVNQGTVVRVTLAMHGSKAPSVAAERVIATGLAERTDPAALVIGPTGLAMGIGGGTLYVADTLANRIAAIPLALVRQQPVRGGADVSVGGSLNSPLGLASAPNGDLLTVNAGDGNLVEVTRSGAQVATKTLEAAGGGSLFGLAVVPHGVYFVDDNDNTLKLLH
jgi:hypothetical protein